MDIDKKTAKALTEAFKKETSCDFCARSDRIILRLIVHPMIKMKSENPELDLIGIKIAAKCMTCIEEDNQ